MPWTRPTLSQIVTRIEADITSRLTGGAALLRRSMLAILARVFAGAIHILHGYLEFLSLQLFIGTAESNYLDKHAVTWGVPRVAAGFAVGSVSFTGTPDGTVIPAGTIVLRDDGTEFQTDAIGTLFGGVAIVAATCKISGEDGNTDSSVTFSMQTPIAGIDDAITILAPGFTGGLDIETDAALRVRILARIQTPPAGGSASDYVAWAKSIAGIDKAWAIASYYGLGTVAVVVAAPSGAAPSGPLVATVQTYINTVRPVTALPTVVPIVPKVIAFHISIKENTADLRDAVTAALTSLFQDDAGPASADTSGIVLLISHINEAILTSGLEDFSITQITVDGVPVAVGNITLTGFQFPVLGAITFATLP